MIKTILSDLFSFIRKPDDRQITLSVKDKLFYVIVLLVLEFVLSYLLIFPVLDGVDDLVDLRTAEEGPLTLVKSFVSFVIVAPIGEELVFRYFLRYNGLKTMFINQKTWPKIFPYLVYLSGILFGFVHISNYTNSGNLFFALSPLIILTQFIGGFIISFIRVRLNFSYGVLYHALWNFMVAIAIPIVQDSFTEPFHQQTSAYTITIEEQLFYKKGEGHYIKIDSTATGAIHKIDVKQYFLQHMLDTLYTKDKYYGGELLINLKLQSKAGINKQELLKIIKKEYDIE